MEEIDFHHLGMDVLNCLDNDGSIHNSMDQNFDFYEENDWKQVDAEGIVLLQLSYTKDPSQDFKELPLQKLVV